jgi:hypothetical protein
MIMTRAFISLTLAAAIFTAAGTTTEAQQAEGVIIPLTDPARPATIDVDMISGGIIVRGTDRKDILLTQRARDNSQDNRRENNRGRGRGAGSGSGSSAPAGMTRLAQAGGFEATENNNRVSIETTSPNRAVDIELQVPRRTNLKLQTVNGGSIIVDAVEGEIEAENVNGTITLTNVAGAVVANTTNGELKASVSRLTPDKAMAFTTLNGNVDLTLPATTKANLKLRSDNGEIYTDFDVQMRAAPAVVQRGGGRGATRIEVNSSIYGAINGGGPEFELRTFNGNIYVRRASQ